MRWGRSSSGSCSHLASTASKSTRAASTGASGSKTKDTQLGVYAYCIAAIAVSPLCRYSSASIVWGSSQPDPVVVATTRTLLSNAPVRSSSSTTSAARFSTVRAESSPAYTRTGSLASSPVSDSISAASGPPLTNAAPCRPSVSQAMADPGPAARCSDTGCTASGSG